MAAVPVPRLLCWPEARWPVCENAVPMFGAICLRSSRKVHATNMMTGPAIGWSLIQEFCKTCKSWPR